jgi:hypothetical protein
MMMMMMMIMIHTAVVCLLPLLLLPHPQVCDVFIDELKRATTDAGDPLSSSVLVHLLQPFLVCAATTDHVPTVRCCGLAPRLGSRLALPCVQLFLYCCVGGGMCGHVCLSGCRCFILPRAAVLACPSSLLPRCRWHVWVRVRLGCLHGCATVLTRLCPSLR